MIIEIDEEWLISLHKILVSIYQKTDDPITSAIPLVHDYNESLISVCVDRHQTRILGKDLYPNLLQRATILMHSIICFHPFVDGNKRTALLATDFYLHWNGYNLIIPYDADDFSISVAKGEQNLNQILKWLTQNTQRNPFTILRHLLCENTLTNLTDSPVSDKIIQVAPHWLTFPAHAIIFFGTKIVEAQERKAKMKKEKSDEF